MLRTLAKSQLLIWKFTSSLRDFQHCSVDAPSKTNQTAIPGWFLIDWKQAHGSIGKMQQTLFGQSRTLRLQLQERIRTEFESLYLSMDCETLPILTESLLDS